VGCPTRAQRMWDSIPRRQCFRSAHSGVIMVDCHQQSFPDKLRLSGAPEGRQNRTYSGHPPSSDVSSHSDRELRP